MLKIRLDSFQSRWIPQRPRVPSGQGSSEKQGCSTSSNSVDTAIGTHRSSWRRIHTIGSPSHLQHYSARDVRVHASSAQVVAVHPAGSISPYKSALWQDVFALMKERLKWEPEPEMQLHVFAAEDVMQGSEGASHSQLFDTACSNSDVFLAVDMKGDHMQFLDSEVEALTTVKGVPTGSLPPAFVTTLAKLPAFLPWVAAASSWGKLLDLWKRRSTDDLAFMIMLAINDFVAPVPSTQVSMGDAGSLVCMFKNCREEVLACVQDEQCKAALDALAECGLNDQVCSYRVIASYESPLFENFSKCILQRHNCLGLKADIPMVPDPVPMAEFRGAKLTWDAAEDIFIGHLAPQAPRAPGAEKDGFSWRVACGKNPAYDFFPCQFQLWYRAKGKGVVWYDPIFKVYTLDGREVWLRRHYRVRRAKTPGAFYFSVLDNGVTSKEYWKIMDCDEQMKWVVFYYSGAATAAGITYRGALICTQTGNLPEDPAAMKPINAALTRCGIEPWEMFGVDNACCSDAPLSVPDYGFIDWKELMEL